MQITCPKCQGQMRQYERSGVTVDQCAECRGIFLDRGELERILDAESSYYAATPPPQPGRPQPQPGYPPVRYRDHDSDEYPAYDQHGHPRRKRRGGFLSDLFD